MTTPSPLPLTFEKATLFIDNIEMIEYTPRLCIEALIKSDKLLEHWDEHNFQHQMSQQNYENEKEQLKAYFKLNKKNCVTVKYKKPKHGWGRPYVYKSLGFTAFRLSVRNTLLGNNYFDFDIKNAQPVILQNICHSHNIPCPKNDEYCANRDIVLEKVCEVYKVERWCAKKLFLRMFFKGSVDKWMKEFNIPTPDLTYSYILELQTELETIAITLKKSNEELYNTARKLKEAKNEKNFIGSFLALYLQEAEKRIMSVVMEWIAKETTLFQKKGIDGLVGAYEYDGLKLLKYNVEKYDKEKLIEDMTKIVYDTFGYNVEWVVKPIEEAYDISNEMLELENETTESVENTDELVLDKDVLEFKLYLDYLIMYHHRAIAELVEKLKPKHFVFNEKDWFCWNTTKWEMSVQPLRNCIMYDLPKHLLDKLNVLTEKYKDKSTDNYKQLVILKGVLYEEIKKKYNTAHEINNIVEVCETIMRNVNLKFDTNRDLLGFNNGVYDINADKFRQYQFDDYVTMSCGFDFEDLREGHIQRDITEIDIKCFTTLRDIFESIHPEQDIRDLLFYTFASGLTGQCIEKFFVFNGGGGNGKGWCNEFMAFTLGDYFCNMGVKLLQVKNDNTGPNPALAGLDKKRYIVFKEPDLKRPLLNNVIRDLTGGGEIEARKCYSNNSKAELFNTTVLECNERCKMATPPEKAESRRFVDILFGSHFTDKEGEVDVANKVFLADPTYKSFEWKTKHRNYFMNLLIDYLQQLKGKKYSFGSLIPKCVEDRSDEYLQSCMDIHNLFIKLFEHTGKSEDYISMKTIQGEFKLHDDYENMSKFERKQYSLENIKKFFSTNRIYKRDFREDCIKNVSGINKHLSNVLLGWRLKPIDDDEPVDEEKQVYIDDDTGEEIEY